jgi:hypothetical protein
MHLQYCGGSYLYSYYYFGVLLGLLLKSSRNEKVTYCAYQEKIAIKIYPFIYIFCKSYMPHT